MAPVVNRLRDALSLPPGAAKLSRADLAELLRVAELAERIRPYAAHKDGCGVVTNARPYSGTMLPGACTSGLQDVLSGRFAGEPDPTTMRGRAEGGKEERGRRNG